MQVYNDTFIKEFYIRVSPINGLFNMPSAENEFIDCNNQHGSPGYIIYKPVWYIFGTKEIQCFSKNIFALINYFSQYFKWIIV